MILNYLGLDLSQAELARLMGTHPQAGTPYSHILRAIKEIGFYVGSSFPRGSQKGFMIRNIRFLKQVNTEK